MTEEINAISTKDTLAWCNHHASLSQVTKQLSKGLEVLLPCTDVDQDIVPVKLDILHAFKQILQPTLQGSSGIHHAERHLQKLIRTVLGNKGHLWYIYFQYCDLPVSLAKINL